tara:strand:- start:761 stop:1000 length:240 start_codon:yes stop_codon:yes gene_type:complete
MVEFNVNENLKNLTEEEKHKILDAYLKVFSKVFPDSKSLKYLYGLFSEKIDPTFTGNCSRCKKRIVTYWQQRLKNWKMI